MLSRIRVWLENLRSHSLCLAFLELNEKEEVADVNWWVANQPSKTAFPAFSVAFLSIVEEKRQKVAGKWAI